MARASLEHSFVPGDSLWSDRKEFRRTAACEKEISSEDRLSERCQKFLNASEKARLQWNLEKAFAGFEKFSNKF
jgi:adenosine deaminase